MYYNTISITLLLVCFCFTLSSCATFILDIASASSLCNTSCSFFDHRIWDTSTSPSSCNGTDETILQVPPYIAPLSIFFDQPCNLSIVNAGTGISFVVPKFQKLYFGNFYFQALHIENDGFVGIWNDSSITGPLNIDFGATFYYFGANPLTALVGSTIAVFGNFTVSSPAQTTLYGNLDVDKNGFFWSSNIGFNQPATANFLISPTFSSTTINGAVMTFNFGLNVQQSISINSNSFVYLYGSISSTSFNVDSTSIVYFIKSNANFQQASLEGQITISSSSIFYGLNTNGIPIFTATLTFAGLSNISSSTQIVFQNVNYQSSGAFDEPTNVTLNAPNVQTVQNTIPVPVYVPFIRIVCSELRAQILTAQSVSTQRINSVINTLSTLEGLTISGSYSSNPFASILINSSVHLVNNAVMQLNSNTTVLGDIHVKNASSLVLQSSNVSGTIYFSNDTSSRINNTIIGNIEMRDFSSVFIQNSTVIGVINNSASLTIDGVVRAANYTQTGTGELIFHSVDFSGSKDSANNLAIEGTAILNGTLSCAIVNNTLFNLTKVIYLIYGKIDGEFSHSRSVGALFNATELSMHYDHTKFGIQVKFDFVSVYFAVGAAVFALIGAIIFLILTGAPRSSNGQTTNLTSEQPNINNSQASDQD